MLLVNVYRTAYNYLVDNLSHKVDKTRSDVKKIARNFSGKATSSSPTPSPADPITETEYSTIPLHPRRDNFPLLNHWSPEKWNALRHPKKGTVPPRGLEAINVLFWEDPSGKLIPPSRRPYVTKDMRSIWQEMHDKGKRLDILTKIGWEVREEFRSRMEALHPWLRLCDDHWKVDQLWSNNFSSWVSALDGKGKRPESLKREYSVGEDDEAGPSKKRTRTLVHQSTRPKPTKKQVAKVRLLPFVPAMHTKMLPD